MRVLQWLSPLVGGIYMEHYICELTQVNNNAWLLQILDKHINTYNALLGDLGKLSNIHDQIVRAFDIYRNLMLGMFPIVYYMVRTGIYIENNQGLHNLFFQVNEVINRIIVHHT